MITNNMPGIIINEDNKVASDSLPTASASTLGGIKVGENLRITDGVLSAINSQYNLPVASASTLGGVKVGANLTISDGVLSATNSYTLPIASANTLGGIKVGTNLSINGQGQLSATDSKGEKIKIGNDWYTASLSGTTLTFTKVWG